MIRSSIFLLAASLLTTTVQLHADTDINSQDQSSAYVQAQVSEEDVAGPEEYPGEQEAAYADQAVEQLVQQYPEFDVEQNFALGVEEAKASRDCGGAILKVIVNKFSQRLRVLLNGKTLHDDVKVSTGMGGMGTPSGHFCPRNFERTHLDHAFSKRGHKVYLYNAVQLIGGIFMHNASSAGVRWLGHKHSHGCVRVDPKVQPVVFSLMQKFKGRVQVIIE